MNRRNFLKAMLATGVAPAIVKAESLMKMTKSREGILLPKPFEISVDIPESGDFVFSMYMQEPEGQWVRHYIPVKAAKKGTAKILVTDNLKDGTQGWGMQLEHIEHPKSWCDEGITKMQSIIGTDLGLPGAVSLKSR